MIPVYQPYFTGKEKEYVNQCLETTWVSSKGAFIGEFEDKFSKYIKAEYVTTVSNGTVAIHLALEALGIGSGDEVIVPTLTYIASVNTIIQTGATPVFVDSLESTWQVDPKDVEAKITAKTRAVMAVHLYGMPCDMDALVKICDKHKLLLIEDCAEAFGTYYKGRHVGTFGDAATFSFFGNKTITTGEGGMVVMKSKQLLDKAYHLKNQGVSQTKEYWHDVVAYNYRMTNICAAIGCAQLESADEILDKKRRIADWYKQGLLDTQIVFHDEIPEMVHSFWMCSILVSNANDRNLLREYLKDNGVESRPVFYPAHTMPHCRSEESFDVAQLISERGINLPSYPDLTKVQVLGVCELIKNFLVHQ